MGINPHIRSWHGRSCPFQPSINNFLQASEGSHTSGIEYYLLPSFYSSWHQKSKNTQPNVGFFVPFYIDVSVKLMKNKNHMIYVTCPVCIKLLQHFVVEVSFQITLSNLKAATILIFLGTRKLWDLSWKYALPKFLLMHKIWLLACI